MQGALARPGWAAEAQSVTAAIHPAKWEYQPTAIDYERLLAGKEAENAKRIRRAI